MKEFKLPDLGEGIHEGELLKWYVNVGDNINEDDPLCDVETDKAAVTIPSPFAGEVIKLNGEVGGTLHVNNVIVVIRDNDSESDIIELIDKPVKQLTDSDKKVELASTKASTDRKKLPPVIETDRPSVDSRRVAAAPATRRLAREMGLDIKLIPGTGPGGRITSEDVRNFSSIDAETVSGREDRAVSEADEVKFSDLASAAIPFYELEKLADFEKEGPVEKETVRSIRKKVAKKTTSSMLIVPHVAHMEEFDVTALEEFRVQQNKLRQGTVKLTMLAFMIKATASLLKKYPMFNASLDPHRNEIVYKKYYNMGFAADTPRGLIVPVIKGADRKSVLEVASEIIELAEKGRDGSIAVDDMRQGTFSITNVGPIGGTGMIPTINYPESAILGMAKVQDKAVVRDGEIVIRKMLPVTLAFDHRIADGAQAAHFVTDLMKLMSDPNTLLLES